jgi:hypothetical protein
MNDDSIAALRVHRSFLANAESHVGDAIQTLRNMQESEYLDVTDGVTNRNRFLRLAKAMNDLGRPDLASIAVAGAALEDQQIARNEQLVKDMAATIGILTFIAAGLGRFSQFANRITRAVSALFS